MWLSAVNGAITFNATIDDRICVIQSDNSTAKSFLLKSLSGASAGGYSYYYNKWDNYTTFDWYHGVIYDRFAIVAFDDADQCIQTLLKIIPYMKCTIILVLNKTNTSVILNKMPTAVRYEVRSLGTTFTLAPKPDICAYCGKVFDGTSLTVDHIIPQNFCDTYMPGTNVREHIRNKIKVCFNCNRKKSDDIWIPNFTRKGWMKYMTPEQIGGYSKVFVEVLYSQYDAIVWWIYVKNMQSHVRHKIDYECARPLIEKELQFFLKRFIDRKSGDWWELV